MWQKRPFVHNSSGGYKKRNGSRKYSGCDFREGGSYKGDASGSRESDGGVSM